MRIIPFKAMLSPSASAASFSCPPYDTVSAGEARDITRRNRDSFIRVVRSETDFDENHDPYSAEVYSTAKRNMEDYIRRGFLVPQTSESFYVYRQQSGGHSQCGIVACCEIDDYDNGLIRKHENTLPVKENDRAAHISVVRAHTGPVLLAFRDNPDVESLVADETLNAPLIDFTDESGTRHTVWRVSAGGDMAAAFEDVPALYIADGHHRAAAAATSRKRIMAANPEHSGNEEYNRFMVIMYQAGDMRVLPYNRCVKDLNGMNPLQFVDAVGKRVRLDKCAAPAPGAPGRLSMYVAGDWYGLFLESEDKPGDPAWSLDAAVLQREILEPVLAITDPRTNRRIEFVGGSVKPAELAKRVDRAEAAVVFSMHPLKMDHIMRVADNKSIMPPKSTWFDPKPRSGLIVHPF